MSVTTQRIETILTSTYSNQSYLELVNELFDSIQIINPNGFNKEFSNFSSHIEGSTHIGNYTAPDDKKLIIVAVRLKAQTYVENSRSRQRSYAKKLIENAGCDAAFIAFYTEGDPKWRLSFVRLDYEMKIENGRLKAAESLTPAKRYSYLVGEGEPCHTAIDRLRIFIDDHNYHPTLNEIEEAFSVERVTDEFFQLYCEKFHQIREHLEKCEDFVIEAEQHNFTSAQFAKKLMGQIVFLYFLQKKGWLGVSAWPRKLNEKEYKNAFYARGAKSRELIPIVYRPIGGGMYGISGSGLESLDDADEAVLASCVKGEPWGTGPHNFMRKLYEVSERRNANFYEDYLEPLFYEALNVNRGEQGYCAALHCRIPFLSGGLFEPIDGYEWQHNSFNLPNSLFSEQTNGNSRTGNGILDIFDRYNFTMSEDEPMEREVAIDPEMLGKVFENLLEVSDRKSTGAFYTPREIVHYMCQESLINYLTGAMKLPDADIRDFILYGDFMKDYDTSKDKRQGSREMYIAESLFKVEADGRVSVNRLYEVDEALASVRVADPAVGSGAFPLGILNEIVRARQNITEYLLVEKKSRVKPSQEAFVSREMHADRSAYRLKCETVKNCIFAADIEPSAVDIAQLRLWLSLVIDDEITPDAQSPLDGHRNPLPLPNLECNILCGNSLIDEFAGIRLINDSVLLGNKEYQVHANQGLYESTLRALMDTQDELFGCDNSEKKKEIKDRITGLRDIIIMGQLEGAPKEMLDAYEETKQMASKPYVLWQLDFARVFREKGGFDIVIGNPPYFNVETFGAKNPIVATLKRKYAEIWMDKSDILFYFIYLGGCISKDQVCYITSNAFLFSDKAKKLRNYIIHSLPIKQIINFENYMVFDAASITSSISVYRKETNPTNKIICSAKVFKDSKLGVTGALYTTSLAFTAELEADSPFSLIPPIQKELDKRIKGNYPLLGSLFKIGSGMQTAANKVYCFNEGSVPYGFPKELIRKHLRGTDIQKYIISEPSEQLLYVEDIEHWEELPREVQAYFSENKSLLINRADVQRRKRSNWWGYAFPMHKEYYNLNKIWCSYRATENCYALDKTQRYIGFTNTTVIFDTCIELNIEYLLALLNSKMMEYFHKTNSKQTGGGVFEYFPNNIERYPIAVIRAEEQLPFIQIVEKIILLKEANPSCDISEYQNHLDSMVYELYGLSSADIDVIEEYST